MQPFTSLRAIAAPLPVRNINTDDIYPGLKGVEVTDPAKMGPLCFGMWRWTDDDRPIPGFILNQPPYDTAQILVTGANYGCGSAREAAVWCMAAIGLRCVIAPSFSDIFYGNCFKNGLLPVRLPQSGVDVLTSQIADPENAVLEVDLLQQKVFGANGVTFQFDIDPYKRDCLLKGLDEIGVTLTKLPLIEAHEKKYHGRRPWLAASNYFDFALKKI